MSLWTMIFLIVLVGCITGVISERYRAMGRVDANKRSVPDGASEHERLARHEIAELRERIKVLERIATDGNSLDASETHRISKEIEALRDRQES